MSKAYPGYSVAHANIQPVEQGRLPSGNWVESRAELGRHIIQPGFLFTRFGLSLYVAEKKQKMMMAMICWWAMDGWPLTWTSFGRQAFF